jgi:hypothetical protein
MRGFPDLVEHAFLQGSQRPYQDRAAKFAEFRSGMKQRIELLIRQKPTWALGKRLELLLGGHPIKKRGRIYGYLTTGIKARGCFLALRIHDKGPHQARVQQQVGVANAADRQEEFVFPK